MTPPAEARQTHTVASGEYLWIIAERLGIPLEELTAMNGLKANERGGFDIAVGQVLYIPSKDKDVDMEKETEQSTNPGDNQNAVGDDEIPAGGRKKSAPAYIKPENRMLRTTTRFPHGRMQYRDDPAQEWIDLESADKERDTSRQPEPINVQQVTITNSSK